MNRIKQTYFEIWGNEQAQNALLKLLLIIFAGLFAVESVLLCTLSFRKPILIAIGQQKTEVLNFTPPDQELLTQELTRAVTHYVLAHYNWDASTVEAAHREAQNYISDRFKQAFLAANSEQIKVAKEKNLKETVYISGVRVDAKTLTARVTVDRILVVGSLRATNPWVLDVHFEYGPRTETNSEGIYITSEQPMEPKS